MLNEYTETITTHVSAGTATVYVSSNRQDGKIHGRIVAIKYEPGTIDTNADLTITGETSAVPVLTKANAGTSTVWYYPLAKSNQVSDGAASAITEVPVWLYNERLKVAVAQGDNSKVGAITLYVDEPVVG